MEIIENNGYAVEVHEVVTEDGYILEMHRIPRSKSGPTRNHPVFVHHGLLGSSADWVLAGPNMSLRQYKLDKFHRLCSPLWYYVQCSYRLFMCIAMQLADAGFDVWLTNCRGNTYSAKHVSLTVNQNAFWDFRYVYWLVFRTHPIRKITRTNSFAKFGE